MKNLTEFINEALLNEETLKRVSPSVLKEYSEIGFEWEKGEHLDINYVGKILDVNWDPEDEEGENLDDKTLAVAHIINNTVLRDVLSDEGLWLAYMEKVLIVSDGMEPLNNTSDGTMAKMFIIYKDQPESDKRKMLQRMKKMERTKVAD